MCSVRFLLVNRCPATASHIVRHEGSRSHREGSVRVVFSTTQHHVPKVEGVVLRNSAEELTPAIPVHPVIPNSCGMAVDIVTIVGRD